MGSPHTQQRIISGLVGLLAAALAPHARAGGIGLYEMGTPDIGLAAAGYAARAQDAGTVFTNPAGMSRLEGTQLQAGLQLTYGHVVFDGNQNSSGFLGSASAGNAIGALPAASMFVTQQLSDRLAVGFGTFSYFGLMENYRNSWVGRYYIQTGTALGMSFLPAVSFKVTNWLSIGAGLNAMLGMFDTDVAVRTGAPGDGKLKIEDKTWGFGASAGILVEPRKGTRVGLTYLSAVALDFSDRPKFTNLGPLGGAIFANPPTLDLGMTVPQSVMLSGYHELNATWALLANVGWQDWSQFGKVDVGVDSANPTSLTANLKYEDTWHGAVGAQYRASEELLFSAGMAYDTAAVSDKNRTFSTPMGEAWRFGLGAEWQIHPSVSLFGAYEFVWAGDMPVTQESVYRGTAAGNFDNSWFSFATLGAKWRF